MGKEKDLHTISTQVPSPEFEHYQNTAKSLNLSLATLARDALRVLHPMEGARSSELEVPQAIAPMVVSDVAVPTARSVREDVDAILGDVPQVNAGGADLSDLEDRLFGMASTRAAAQAVEAPAVTTPPQHRAPPVIGEEPHPCLHLDRAPPRGLTRTDCQGSCRAQNGRPCHWPVQTARECVSFRGMRRGPGVVL